MENLENKNTENKDTGNKEEETVSITANFKALPPKDKKIVRAVIIMTIFFAIGALYFAFVK